MKNFESGFSELQTDTIDVCSEYSGSATEKIYIYRE